MTQTTTYNSSSSAALTGTIPPPSLSFSTVTVNSTAEVTIGLNAKLGNDGDKFASAAASLSAVLLDASGTPHTGSATQTQLDNLVDALNSQPGQTSPVTLTLTVPPPNQVATSSPVVFDSLTITGSFPAVDSAGQPKGTWPLNLTIDLTGSV